MWGVGFFNKVLLFLLTPTGLDSKIPTLKDFVPLYHTYEVDTDQGLH